MLIKALRDAVIGMRVEYEGDKIVSESIVKAVCAGEAYKVLALRFFEGRLEYLVVLSPESYSPSEGNWLVTLPSAHFEVLDPVLPALSMRISHCDEYEAWIHPADWGQFSEFRDELLERNLTAIQAFEKSLEAITLEA